MNSKKLADLERIIKLSSSFNVVEIANILSELITQEEEREFVPMICYKPNYKRYRTYVVVAEKYLQEEEKMYGDATPEAWVHNTFNYGPYIGIYYSNIDHEDVENKDISFGLDSNLEPIRSGRGRGYVNRFMEYLFSLQLANNGERLTYEEMQEALNNFTRLEKNNIRQKIKKRDN